jgi:signal peptidase I
MNTATRAASISAVAALVLAAAWFFWPTALGGATTYVSTYGASMEPGLHTGDLAVLRPAGSYSVGDVVAYRSESLDTVVMHRIVAGDAAGFVTQGDNNDWLDEDRPTDDEILGRLFLSIPQGGKALAALRSPGVVLALGAGAAAGVLTAALPRRRRRGARRPAHRRRPPSFSVPPSLSLPPSFSVPTRALARQVAIVSGAVVILAGAGSVVLLTLPTTEVETRTLPVIQQGRFAYSGEAVAGTTYPSGVIETGDTVWTRLARQLTVTFTNVVTGTRLTDVEGALRLDVVVTAADGWSAVVGSGPAVALENGTATASVGLDPDGAADLLRRHYDEIGVEGGTATLSVRPVAETTGAVQGEPFVAGSPGGLDFTLAPGSLTLAGDPDAVLTTSTSTPVAVEEVARRTFSVLGIAVPLGVARVVAGGLLLVALAVLGGAAWVSRPGRGGVAEQFVVRHADRIVPVATFTPGPTVIDVSDAESLHRVAERFDTIVLHHAGAEEDVFAVRDVDATYRFVVPGRAGGLPPVPAPASEPMTSPLPRAVPASRFA